jgi:A/G-specific adenine glycosylase
MTNNNNSTDSDLKNALLPQVFRDTLMAWHIANPRPLPWKTTRNPYFIWLSEIILQQTRVDQGTKYYIKFTETFPTIEALANAPDDQVMKLWEGLGYYSRARNLHLTAKYVTQQYGGHFPSAYHDIRALKGIGDYTAAAIASFAYDLPHAVLDGNVYRVLSRIFGIETPIDLPPAKKEFTALADVLLDQAQPAAHNQAIMDFGATWCTPKAPKCLQCPMQQDCIAFTTQKVDLLPIKVKKMIKKDRYFQYLIVRQATSVWIHKRLEKDIWQDLYDFPSLETETWIEETELKNHSFFNKNINHSNYNIRKISKPYKQVLTHQNIYAVFWEIDISTHENGLENENYLKIFEKNLDNFAFPRIIDLYLQEQRTQLALF